MAFKKGSIPWNLGKTYKQTKKYTSEAIERYRQKALEQFKGGMPESTKQKLRGPRPHMRGSNNPNW